ncbi:peptidoglycan-binding domain-containing protein [Streptomyces sp. MI02-2A]|uniref:peptidoglycan-binding domain-containing protein n=1 Tax=unclassified Streptomyces TaxID=2593676 RepID=UPI000E384872|nr:MULTISPECIES: peptidoglycan-binding domain-containing protein [unclassified Streptomyces]MDX3264725.1 peptidoglycan-binding domain-containing protein [Streptomyces sp. MI02-2A]REE64492.1 hypothetical protein BX257_7183 [Streptomyces sp. 3212.3]
MGGSPDSSPRWFNRPWLPELYDGPSTVPSAPQTYSGIKSFQQWWNQAGYFPHLSVDGVVGPQTGDRMLGYVGAGCYLYVPGTD